MMNRIKCALVALMAAVVVTSTTSAHAQPAVGTEEETAVEPWRRGLVLGGAGAVYAGVGVWAYFAWYKKRTTTDEIVFQNDGWFGADTYAGGADKIGHMYSNYTISRLTSSLLRSGGWDPLTSSLIASGLTLSFFTGIELKDGYHNGFGFSWADMVFNTAGNALALAMVNFPTLDAMFDFKLEYVPTDEYLTLLRDKGVVDAAEDYSGQTFMLAYHLDSIDAIARSESLGWLGYFDTVTGFQAINYLPEPADPDALPRQEVFVGVSLNVQKVIADTFYPNGPKSRTGRITSTVVDGVTEVVAVPATTIRLAGADRVAEVPPPGEEP